MLGRCRRFDAWSQQTLDKAAEKFALDGRDAALCSRLCLTVLQNAALCDFYIGCYASRGVQQIQPQVLDILRLGVSQILFMDKIPVSAAVDQSVALTKATAPKAAGLVNAVLRRVAEHKDDLPAIPGIGTAMELSVRYSHPLWLCERMVQEKGYAFTRTYLETNNCEADLTVSVNLNRTDVVSLLKRFHDAGIPAKQSDLSPVSIRLEHKGNVAELPGFSHGDFFVQDAAAAAAVLCAGPEKGMRVLDACAAPGGKSFLCASLMKNEGEIVSCDLHAKKLDRLDNGASRLGFSCIQTIPMNAAEPYERLKNSFDLVLADAPCSGFGVIRKKPEIRYKDPAELAGLPEIQRRILSGAAECVRPGGTLLYSTCTVFPEENDDVVDAFLETHPAFCREEARTIWPQEFETDGFYYCQLRRNDPDQ